MCLNNLSIPLNCLNHNVLTTWAIKKEVIKANILKNVIPVAIIIIIIHLHITSFMSTITNVDDDLEKT